MLNLIDAGMTLNLARRCVWLSKRENDYVGYFNSDNFWDFNECSGRI